MFYWHINTIHFWNLDHSVQPGNEWVCQYNSNYHNYRPFTLDGMLNFLRDRAFTVVWCAGADACFLLSDVLLTHTFTCQICSGFPTLSAVTFRRVVPHSFHQMFRYRSALISVIFTVVVSHLLCHMSRSSPSFATVWCGGVGRCSLLSHV